mgnify:FL=1
MASRLGKLAKMGGAVAGFFRGGADNTAPNPPKQPETDLAEGARKLPKTRSSKSNQKVSRTPSQLGQAPDPALKTLKTDLGQYANDLTANDQQLAMVAQGLLSGPAPKGLAAARSQVDQLADGMVEDLDTFCSSKLGIDLSQALSKINFQGAHWEHDLKLGLKNSLGSTGFPPDTSERMAGWLLDQMVATGSVCMAALEEGDDRVFGEYVKLATGAVHEQLGLIQDAGHIDALVQTWSRPSSHDRLNRVQAFKSRLDPAPQRRQQEDASVDEFDPPPKKQGWIDEPELNQQESTEKNRRRERTRILLREQPPGRVPTETIPVPARKPDQQARGEGVTAPTLKTTAQTKTPSNSGPAQPTPPSSIQVRKEPVDLVQKKRMSGVQTIAEAQRKKGVPGSTLLDLSESQ